MKAELLRIRPASDKYPQHSYDAVGHCKYVLFETESWGEWLGSFGCGDATTFSTAILFPVAETVLVIAEGKGYVVDVNTGKLKYLTHCNYLVGAVAVPNCDLIIAWDFATLYALTSSGEVWQSDEIAIDGIQILQVTSDYLWCQITHYIWQTATLYFNNWQMLYAQGDDDSAPAPPDALYVDTQAIVVECYTTNEGITASDDSDMAMHVFVYEYVYRLPDTNASQKHRETVKFHASAFGRWFSKYPKGFRFPIRYNKLVPTEHIRLNNFNFD